MDMLFSLLACDLDCNFPNGRQNFDCTKCECVISFRGLHCSGK